MTTVSVTRALPASPDHVFASLVDLDTTPDRVPDVERVEWLTEPPLRVGTRFREHRRAQGKTMTFELEVAAYDPEARTVRFVCDAHGTVWDTTMTVVPRDAEAELTIAMAAIGHRWTTRVFNRLMRGFFRRGIVDHLDALAVSLRGESSSPDRTSPSPSRSDAPETA